MVEKVTAVGVILGALEQYHYPCFELLQQFAPSADIRFEEPGDLTVTVTLVDDSLCLVAQGDGETIDEHYHTHGLPPTKDAFKGLLYTFLTEVFGRKLAWGTLTGIKPVKIAHEAMVEKRMTMEEGAQAMMRDYFVSSPKAHLAAGMAQKEMAIIYPQDPHLVSVYVGIPICPAKCSYCSFVSTIADKKGILAQTYLDNLVVEIEATKEILAQKGLVVDTLYIGGGTPSVLSVDQLVTLFKALEGSFIHPGLREFTFEAGRPETTTRAKLALIKSAGADRICLNPQTMNAETLKAIGRNHTPEDIIKTHGQIKKMGFESVNMDLIIGLGHEAPEAFLHSLDAVIALAPENLTVHSLALKKGSRLKESQGHHVEQLYNTAFYEAVDRRIAAAGYTPYYLYRQKYALGSGENVGYTKAGHPGIYNVLMMAEKQTILGIGAGSTGKIYEGATNRFEKVFTVKDVKTYNERRDEIIARKIAAYHTIVTE